MIQRDVDAALPEAYDIHVSEWTFVPSSSKTPDTPAYYVARVQVRTRAGELSEDAIIPMHELPSGDRAALEALVNDKIQVATLKAKALLDDSLAPSDAVRVRRRLLRRVATRVR